MSKRLLSFVNYTIAALLSLFGLCDCSAQKNEYGCPSTYYQEMEPQPEEDASSDGASGTPNNNNPANKEEENNGES